MLARRYIARRLQVERGNTMKPLAEMFDYETIRHEVHDYCSCAYPNTYNEPAIVHELIDLAYDTGFPIRSIDDVDFELFDNIVESCENSFIVVYA